MPQITAVLNPVSQKRVTATVPAGKPLHEIMDLPDDVYVEVNGKPYADEPLQDDDIVTMVVVPQGDTNARKDLARTGIMLAVQVAAAIATQGMSSTWAQLGIRLAATAGGAWAAYELIPLPRPDTPPGPARPNRLGALTGSSNRIAPYSIVPRVYGKRKIYPLMSAKPFTEVVANEQYLRLLFVISDGPLLLTGKTGFECQQ